MLLQRKMAPGGPLRWMNRQQPSGISHDHSSAWQPKNNPVRLQESSIRVLRDWSRSAAAGHAHAHQNPLHILQEVIDNASDEALGGYGKSIIVTSTPTAASASRTTAAASRSACTRKKSADRRDRVHPPARGRQVRQGQGRRLRFSGGLHGVGVSVTNALATRLEVTVAGPTAPACTPGVLGGDVVEPLSSVAPRDAKKSGTRVTVWPDAKYFDSPAISQVELQRLLRSKAVLLPGVSVTLANAKTGEAQTWQYNDGLRGYLTERWRQTGSGEP
jgi:topoisomerase-4 subunit B